MCCFLSSKNYEVVIDTWERELQSVINITLCVAVKGSQCWEYVDVPVRSGAGRAARQELAQASGRPGDRDGMVCARLRPGPPVPTRSVLPTCHGAGAAAVPQLQTRKQRRGEIKARPQGHAHEGREVTCRPPGSLCS